MSKIKICGLTRPEDIQAVNRWQPDYIGLVFAGRKRRVTPAQARTLRAALHPSITAVGVFVNAPIELIRQLWREGTIQWVQLHGQEDEAYIRALRACVRAPIIQAFSLQSRADVQRLQASSADLVLADHGGGGSGRRFDWSWTAYIQRPYILAGGITCQTIQEALRLRPYAVDISSGAETGGHKEEKKIQALVQCVRRRP